MVLVVVNKYEEQRENGTEITKKLKTRIDQAAERKTRRSMKASRRKKEAQLDILRRKKHHTLTYTLSPTIFIESDTLVKEYSLSRIHKKFH